LYFLNIKYNLTDDENIIGKIEKIQHEINY